MTHSMLNLKFLLESSEQKPTRIIRKHCSSGGYSKCNSWIYRSASKYESGIQTSYDHLNCQNINSGLSYALGAVFIGVLIALTALLMKYKKRDDERLSKNLNRRKSQAQDEKQILKSYLN